MPFSELTVRAVEGALKGDVPVVEPVVISGLGGTGRADCAATEVSIATMAAAVRIGLVIIASNWPVHFRRDTGCLERSCRTIKVAEGRDARIRSLAPLVSG
jgi:hypothetical protein